MPILWSTWLIIMNYPFHNMFSVINKSSTITVVSVWCNLFSTCVVKNCCTLAELSDGKLPCSLIKQQEVKFKITSQIHYLGFRTWIKTWNDILSFPLFLELSSLISFWQNSVQILSLQNCTMSCHYEKKKKKTSANQQQ